MLVLENLGKTEVSVQRAVLIIALAGCCAAHLLHLPPKDLFFHSYFYIF